MGLLGNLYYATTMLKNNFPFVKNIVNKAMNMYTGTISADEWTKKVASVDVSDLTPQELQADAQLAQQMSDLVEKQCPKLAEAMNANPEEWGAKLTEKGIDQEKIMELQQTVEQSGSVPPLEIVKLALDTPATDAVPSAPQAQQQAQNGAEIPPGQNYPEDAVKTQTESQTYDRVAAMNEAFGSTLANAANQMQSSSVQLGE